MKKYLLLATMNGRIINTWELEAENIHYAILKANEKMIGYKFNTFAVTEILD